MADRGKLLRSFLTLLKGFWVAILTAIFIYWSSYCISKFISPPILSSVSFTFGDDDRGNIEFPTLSICLNSFKTLTYATNGPFYDHCSSTAVRFYDTLRSCIEIPSLDPKPNTSTTTISSIFGNVMDNDYYDNYQVQKYPSIEAVVNATKVLALEDILNGFKFGKEIDLNPSTEKNTKIEIMKEYWKATLDSERGFCYTFDPKDHGKSKVPIFGKDQHEKHSTLLYMTLYLKFGKLNSLNKEGKLDIFIHNSRAEFLNDVYDFPKITVKTNDVIHAKVEKTNLESIPRDEKPCIEDENIPIGELCLYVKANELFMNSTGCKLPWMENHNLELCPLIEKVDGNKTETIDDKVIHWMGLWITHSSSKHALSCPNAQRCKLARYDISETRFNGNFGHYGNARVQIQMKTKNVLNIVENQVYDFQSFIAEVGGILGLFLGLSLYDIIEYFVNVSQKICEKVN